MKLTYTSDKPESLNHFVTGSRWGRIEVLYSEDAIHECSFTDKTPDKPAGKMASRSHDRLPGHVKTFLDEWDAFGTNGDTGKGFSGKFVAKGTAFEHEAWKALRQVGFGKTASYGEIAKKIGRPGAARAIGLACNKNPLPLLIPCHRIVGSNGKLTGFAGGLDVKEKLLAMESNELPLGQALEQPLERKAANG